MKNQRLFNFNIKSLQYFYLLGICFVKGKSLQKVIYNNNCL